MRWKVEFCEEFWDEFHRSSPEFQAALAVAIRKLEQGGPFVGRPLVDTLKGSSYFNLKELRLQVMNEPWRAAFAFDPKRNAIVLCAGNKANIKSDRFYRLLIERAEMRFARHLRKG